MKRMMPLGLVALLAIGTGCVGNGSDTARIEGSGGPFDSESSEYVIVHLDEARQGYRINSDDSVDAVFNGGNSWMEDVGNIDRDSLEIEFTNSSVEAYSQLVGTPWVQFYKLGDNLPGDFSYGNEDIECTSQTIAGESGLYGVVGDNSTFDPYVTVDFSTSAEDLYSSIESTMSDWESNCDN